jgi:DNA segregation ATPase FtsK/SpoIIIE-like protein
MDDPLYEKAVMVVKAANPPSIANIQRRLMIGHNRASRLMDELIERGLIERIEYERGARYKLVPSASGKPTTEAAKPL